MDGIEAIVTTGGLNKYTKAAWLFALLLVVPIVLMRAVNVPYAFLIVIDVILSIFSFVCLWLLPYFYVNAYLAVRKWNRTRIPK